MSHIAPDFNFHTTKGNILADVWGHWKAHLIVKKKEGCELHVSDHADNFTYGEAFVVTTLVISVCLYVLVEQGTSPMGCYSIFIVVLEINISFPSSVSVSNG